MTKILYVEDDLSSQRLVQRILTAEGFDVTLAEDGLKAIEAARREKPDLVLMDINISGLDGYEVTTRLRTIDGLEKAPDHCGDRRHPTRGSRARLGRRLQWLHPQAH